MLQFRLSQAKMSPDTLSPSPRRSIVGNACRSLQLGPLSFFAYAVRRLGSILTPYHLHGGEGALAHAWAAVDADTHAEDKR